MTMGDYLNLEQLTAAPQLDEDDVVLRDGRVRVRALTRGEVNRVRSQVKSIADAIKRTAELEAKMLALAMVNPTMTVAGVREWQDNSPAGEIEHVVHKVQELSGLLDGADKEAYQEFDRDSEAEFRLPPG